MSLNVTSHITSERLKALRVRAEKIFSFRLVDGSNHVPADMFISLIDILLDEHTWQGDLGSKDD